jgi:hypothetical protein
MWMSLLSDGLFERDPYSREDYRNLMPAIYILPDTRDWLKPVVRLTGGKAEGYTRCTNKGRRLGGPPLLFIRRWALEATDVPLSRLRYKEADGNGFHA